MLFRKPFAFLIKYFKVIHFTLAIMIIYLLLRTNHLFRFIGEYMNSTLSTVNVGTASQLFPPIVVVIIIGVFLLTIIILALMSFKKKPVHFYIFNILVYGFVIFTFLYAYTNIKALEDGLLDVRTLKLIRDFSLTALILQAMSLITVSIRATGFDIKKFDFDEDVEDLKITAEDNEEFEVDVELDTDQLKRNIKKSFRHAKYVYIENRFIIHMIVLLIIGLICSIIYLNVGVYHKIYKQNTVFETTEFMLNITGSYITNKDYHNHVIEEDKKLLVIQYQVRSNYAVNKKTFKPERFTLTIDGETYRNTDAYWEKLYDLGYPYRGEYMTTSFQNYTLTYELPKDSKPNKIILKYQDMNDKTIQVKITPITDEQKTVVASPMLGEEVSLEKSLLKNSQLNFIYYELAPTFTHYYSYCVTEEECYTGMEYITPNISGNTEKILLKLQGTFTLDEKSSITRLTDFYSVLRDFGVITYKINGETKELHSQFVQVKPTKHTDSDIYYIEVPKELEEAETIEISFVFRENIYKYVVK